MVTFPSIDDVGALLASSGSDAREVLEASRLHPAWLLAVVVAAAGTLTACLLVPPIFGRLRNLHRKYGPLAKTLELFVTFGILAAVNVPVAFHLGPTVSTLVLLCIASVLVTVIAFLTWAESNSRSAETAEHEGEVSRKNVEIGEHLAEIARLKLQVEDVRARHEEDSDLLNFLLRVFAAGNRLIVKETAERQEKMEILMKQLGDATAGLGEIRASLSPLMRIYGYLVGVTSIALDAELLGVTRPNGESIEVCLRSALFRLKDDRYCVVFSRKGEAHRQIVSPNAESFCDNFLISRADSNFVVYASERHECSCIGDVEQNPERLPFFAYNQAQKVQIRSIAAIPLWTSNQSTNAEFVLCLDCNVPDFFNARAIKFLKALQAHFKEQLQFALKTDELLQCLTQPAKADAEVSA